MASGSTASDPAGDQHTENSLPCQDDATDIVEFRASSDGTNLTFGFTAVDPTASPHCLAVPLKSTFRTSGYVVTVSAPAHPVKGVGISVGSEASGSRTCMWVFLSPWRTVAECMPGGVIDAVTLPLAGTLTDYSGSSIFYHLRGVLVRPTMSTLSLAVISGGVNLPSPPVPDCPRC